MQSAVSFEVIILARNSLVGFCSLVSKKRASVVIVDNGQVKLFSKLTAVSQNGDYLRKLRLWR